MLLVLYLSQLNVPTWDRRFLRVSTFSPGHAGNARYRFFFYFAIVSLAFIIISTLISPGTAFQGKCAMIVGGGPLGV